MDSLYLYVCKNLCCSLFFVAPKPRAQAYLIQPEYWSLLVQHYRKHFLLQKHVILVSLFFFLKFIKIRLIVL